MRAKTQVKPTQIATDPTSEVAILTAGNQLILPDSLMAAYPEVTCFTVVDEGERIILIPVPPGSIEAAWEKVAAQDLTEQDIADAVRWARES